MRKRRRLVALLPILLTLLVGSAAAEPRKMLLDRMSEAVSAWFAADFPAIETIAESAIRMSPPAGEGRADALLAASFAATLADEFEVGANLAAAVRRGEDDPAVAFVRAFNKAGHGEPLAVLALTEPLTARGSQTSVWSDLLAGVAGRAASAIGRHAEAIRLTRESRVGVASLLGEDQPLSVLARLWYVDALVAASAAEAERELSDMLGVLQKRPGELPLLGMLLIHAGIATASAEDIAGLTQTVFDQALARLPEGNTLVALALEDIAYAAGLSGDYRRELEALDAANGLYMAKLAKNAPVLGNVAMGMAMASANLGEHADAVRLADVALDLTRAGTGGTSVITAGRFAEAATVNLLAGDFDRALALVRNARRLFGVAGAADWIAARLFIPMQEAKILMAAGRPAEAVEVQTALLADIAQTHWAGGLAASVVEADQALAFSAAGDAARALVAARHALGGLATMRGTGSGIAAGGTLAGSSGLPTISHSFRLAAQTLVRSAWREARK